MAAGSRGLRGSPGALENRWLDAFCFYGVEADGRARAELALEIDWAKHKQENKAGRFLVSVDNMAAQEGATDLVVSATGLFTDFLTLRRLTNGWRYRATEKVERSRALLERVLRELGLVQVGPMEWVDGEREYWPNADDPDLIELHVACTMVV